MQLVGTSRPSPAKAKQFREVDLVSARASIDAAVRAGVSHFVYVSVAHPAPVMHAYIAVRREVEELLRASGLCTTILRPWYILGPGHRWPAVLLPFYGLARLVPATRASAVRLAPVPLHRMVRAMVAAVEDPPADSPRIMETPAIRHGGATAQTSFGRTN